MKPERVNLRRQVHRVKSGIFGASEEIEKRVAEIEKGLSESPLPEKIEVGNWPIWESVYKSYKYADNKLVPNYAEGVSFLNSKILNVPVKYIIGGIIFFKIIKK